MNGVENMSVFCDFDSLDLDSVNRDLSDEISEALAIKCYLVDKYCRTY